MTPAEVEALPTCPLCGMYSEYHDKTLTGTLCNLHKPFLRCLAHMRLGWRRAWVDAQYAKIRRDDALARLDEWERENR